MHGGGRRRQRYGGGGEADGDRGVRRQPGRWRLHSRVEHLPARTVTDGGAGRQWCDVSGNPPDCHENVAAIQTAINNSIKTLNAQKATLGVNAPYTPPPTTTKGLFMPALAHRARPGKKTKPTVLSTVVLASIKKVTLAPGQKKTVHMPIPAFVRKELKKLLGKKSKTTLHGKLVVQIVANGSYTRRTVPVTIHLSKPKKKR
jgi:hypothetical protein